MSSDFRIQMHGLKQFRRDLRQLDKTLPKGIKVAGNKAADVIVEYAKPRVPIGPAKGGHAASSIRKASTTTAARVAGGGKRFPYYPWLDFGGRVGRRHSVKRPVLKTGRYIWLAYVKKKAKVKRILNKELTKLARDAGLRPH